MPAPKTMVTTAGTTVARTTTAARKSAPRTPGLRAVVTVLAVAAALCGCASPSSPEARSPARGSREGGTLLSWEQTGELSPSWPYLIRIAGRRGELVYFGAYHTFSPDDPQLRELERLWQGFNPDIAFNEGGNPPVEDTRTAAVERYGEPGLVRFLAARDNVPVASLDPSLTEQVAYLGKSHPTERLKLFYLLRTAAQTRDRDGVEAVDGEIERVLEIYNRQPGLMGPPRTPGEVEDAFVRHIPDRGSYRDVPREWFDPVRTDTFLNRIARDSSDYRDRYMVELLSWHVELGERVLAVVGGTHVVRQEPALRRRLE